jgi:hypothetical protein
MVYLNALKNKGLQPRKPLAPKILQLVEGSRIEKELIIFFQKSTKLWYCYNGEGYSTSFIDNRITYLPLLELKDEVDFTTYSIQNVSITDKLIDNYWVSLLTYDTVTAPQKEENESDDSGLVEGKCNLKNITFTFDGQSWHFMNKGLKIYFHSDILKTSFGEYDLGIGIDDQVTFREITGYLTKAGKYWIFILHRKPKTIE